MKKSIYSIMRLLLYIAITMCIFSMSAYATDNLIPYTPGEAQGSIVGEVVQAEPSTSQQTNYAEQLFQKPTMQTSSETQEIISQITNIASVLLTFIIGVIPAVLVIQMIIDICCILIKPVALLVSHLPWQINSDEVIMITGIQHVSTGEGNNTSSNIEKKDLKGENPFLFYLKSRLLTIVIAITILLLLGSGVLFKLIFTIANFIVNMIAGLA